MQQFDLLIIGGGISGLGVALEASRRGLSTLIIEKNRLASATSNNTLRIIHGGFRYLQNADIPRVIQSLCDQRELVRELPEVIKPLPCLMPLTRFGLKSRIPVQCAALAYGMFMKLFRSPLKAPHIVSANFIDRNVPALRGLAPHGALCWYDAVMTEPLKVAEHFKEILLKTGLTIVEDVAVSSVERSESGGFTVSGANSEQRWHAKQVVNTLGPWVDSINVAAELKGPRPAWCKGFNLITSRQIDPTYGIGVESRDGRLFFCVPRGNGTSIGTWYVPHSDPAEAAGVSEEEIAMFLASFNEAFPSAQIRRDEVVATDVGVLPMTAVTATGPRLQAHETITNRGNYIEVISTKYTAFRSQGGKVLG